MQIPRLTLPLFEIVESYPAKWRSARIKELDLLGLLQLSILNHFTVVLFGGPPIQSLVDLNRLVRRCWGLWLLLR